MKTALAVGITLAALGVAVVAPAKMMHDEAAQIAAAKTAKQHEALAAEYARKATEARSLATKHDNMGAMYKDASTARAHCKAISDNYVKIAQELDALAAGEREL